MIEDDLAVFFPQGEFAVECIRTRPGVGDAVFAGIFSHTDEDALDGHSITGTHHLAYATDDADLEAGDTLTSGGITYAVRRSDRVNDGRESVATLRVVEP